jgi:hypothetical protein
LVHFRRVAKFPAPFSVSSGLKSPFGLAIVGGALFASVQTGGQVVTAAVSGGATTTLASGQSKPGPIAADASGVYWINQNGNTVHSIPVAGGSVQELSAGTSLQAIALDASCGYYLSDAALVRFAKL